MAGHNYGAFGGGGAQGGAEHVLWGALRKPDLFGQLGFKFVQSLRVDASSALLLGVHKVTHFLRNFSFNFKLVGVWSYECDRVLAEKVPDQHLLNV